jgi:hypothetical protein
MFIEICRRLCLFSLILFVHPLLDTSKFHCCCFSSSKMHGKLTNTYAELRGSYEDIQISLGKPFSYLRSLTSELSSDSKIIKVSLLVCDQFECKTTTFAHYYINSLFFVIRTTQFSHRLIFMSPTMTSSRQRLRITASSAHLFAILIWTQYLI